VDRERNWEHIAMHEEIRPVLENFRKLFPSQQQPSREVVLLSAESVSTATISHPDYGLNSIAFTPPKEPDIDGN